MCRAGGWSRVDNGGFVFQARRVGTYVGRFAWGAKQSRISIISGYEVVPCSIIGKAVQRLM